uniref:Queuine tRNA-ribosyltransferase catalytic subunit 1 n=1 Tax=Chromera velia CCMP2878 TaxID=1169474 RepID=A0A0G4HL47_9ALVE|mmetsp:Transcript_42625/g.84065  ORF Transcript_42625/g.84065 Transcript_42625/m.84065 type:complete len:523 (-) Transcript_42625:60-1628(-)|eukprot:Cvel_7386.t1-p1 / transcript=Cvel_7386.t1 / gene=Cvel_7386 / organism=Chromera_velia_CCMP2878 / gene_product=Queuine tRNA-ribosyltransferase, putative / transcript_product=Queuine tRNA-ribosyltransferase, putative / location=Cvel_scaffold384:79330-85052(+) / protein_length=522 / sequence_SO=supercontig / SO=protein_coding / is_pseudo=false
MRTSQKRALEESPSSSSGAVSLSLESGRSLDGVSPFYFKRATAGGFQVAPQPPLPPPNWSLRPSTARVARELGKSLQIPKIPQGKALAMNVWHVDGRARAGVIALPHGPVETPVFMPVGTQAVIKSLTSGQLDDIGPQIILNNTYHLASRPGCEILERAGGSHRFMRWPRNLLTDSGGFQMVSLSRLCSISEEGVLFEHPHTKKEMLLTPEKSVESQNAIGADILMQLDDVVSATCTDRARVEEAAERTLRWLDRCISAHQRPSEQNLFGIVQGGLFEDLREKNLKGMAERNLPGYAIGGLSGGESKDQFWRVVEQCARPGKGLPEDRPRYLMGVGYPLDLVCCVALGVDMFDCVYPCRTARFGTALVPEGMLRVKKKEFNRDFRALQADCSCYCCSNFTRAFLHFSLGKEPVASQLLTIHNIHFLLTLMDACRAAILRGTFYGFVRDFLRKQHPPEAVETDPPPPWVRECLKAAGIHVGDMYDWEAASRVWLMHEEEREKARKRTKENTTAFGKGGGGLDD